MKKIFLIAISMMVVSPSFAADLPDKCRDGYIIKRDVFSSSGSSSPFDDEDRRYAENKIDVKIQGRHFKISYKTCWSNGFCTWIDSDHWETLGDSTHGQLHSKDGYSAFYGTMPGSNTFYVCWFRE